MENETPAAPSVQAGDPQPEPRPFVPVTTSRPIAPVQGRGTDSVSSVPTPSPSAGSVNASASSQSSSAVTTPMTSSVDTRATPVGAPTTITADPTLTPKPDEPAAASVISPSAPKSAKKVRLVWVKQNKLTTALIITSVMGTLIGTVSAWTYQASRLKKERAAQAQLMREKQVLHNSFEAYKRANPESPASSEASNN